MNLPTVKAESQNRDILQEFRGYNHNYRINDNEFYNEENVSSDGYPVLVPRKPREDVAFNPGRTLINGITVQGDEVYFVNQNQLQKVTSGSQGFNDLLTLTAGMNVPRQLVKMGAYIVVFPDGKYINTLDTNDKGDINNSYDADGGSVTYTISDIDGVAYTITYTSDTQPSNPQSGEYWLNTGATPNVLEEYSGSQWITIDSTYIKIAATNIAAGYASGDGVKITGIGSTGPQDLNGQKSVLQAAYHDAAGDGAGDYVVVIGIMSSASVTEAASALKMERKAPKMDFVVEANNRLWGCRHGTNNDGEFVNEIYASKLGDFKNWYVFNGISTDSYMASVGTPGDFTGAIAYLGYPIFFKEDHLHKIYGNQPSNFQINTTACRGVVKGAGRSLAICDERVYYKSRSGVCVYDGSLPADISSAFGNERYSAVDSAMSSYVWASGAVGGADENKYYLSCKSEKDGKWNLFVYDTRLGIWHREDETRAAGFANCKGVLYYVDVKDLFGGQSRKLRKYNESASEVITWSVESGEIGLVLPDKQYISRVVMSMWLNLNSHASISIEYDGIGGWHHVTTAYGNGHSAISVPVMPHRCNYFRIRVSCVGYGRVYSITKTIEQGSDR